MLTLHLTCPFSTCTRAGQSTEYRPALKGDFYEIPKLICAGESGGVMHELKVVRTEWR